jgi:acetyl-CoA carboxylase biotin carboxyl carrier protein
MGLTDDDVREILRIIDDSNLDELRIETPEFRLHVRRGGAPPPSEARPPATPAAEVDASANGVATIDSPMLGTFYRASAPGEEPFVDVGSQVGPDTIVCLIEVMKMMNSIKAGVSGTVVEVCARNAEVVEDGEPLFRVQPQG